VVLSRWAQGPGCGGRVALAWTTLADDRGSARGCAGVGRVRPKHAGTVQGFSEPPPAAARQQAAYYLSARAGRADICTKPAKRHGRPRVKARQEWVRDPVSFYVYEQPTHPRVLTKRGFSPDRTSFTRSKGVKHRCQPRTINMTPSRA
jgi:hypothetical protein